MAMGAGGALGCHRKWSGTYSTHSNNFEFWPNAIKTSVSCNHPPLELCWWQYNRTLMEVISHYESLPSFSSFVLLFA